MKRLQEQWWRLATTSLLLLLENAVVIGATDDASSAPGWNVFFSDNLHEYDNVAVTWDAPDQVPSWLGGTYLKPGPARTRFQGERSYQNWLDGWAKLNKFHINSSAGIAWTSKFLKTPLYRKLETNDGGDMLPHSTLGPVAPRGGWSSFRDALQVLQNGPNDNTVVTLTRFQNNQFVASTDAPTVNLFNVTTLTYQATHTPMQFASFGSSAHWQREPGTNHMLNFHIHKSLVPWRASQLGLYRYPHGDLYNPQLIGKFDLDENAIPMIHSFSVTYKHAIFFVYPVTLSLSCLLWHLMQNLIQCLRHGGGGGEKNAAKTLVVVMDLKTGAVVTRTHVQRPLYSTHHINAYETTTTTTKKASSCPSSEEIAKGKAGSEESDDREATEQQRELFSSSCQVSERDDDAVVVVVDMVLAPWYALKNATDLTVLRRQAAPDRGSTSAAAAAAADGFEIVRFTIPLDDDGGAVTESRWSKGAHPFHNQFDFPTIHPNYQGRDYCFVYGQAQLDGGARTPLIKKNICDSTQDKVWHRQHHYTGEPLFIPRPNATAEDDGVVLSVVLDGTQSKSYLLLLDATSFETLTVAYLPDYIPFSIHGTWIQDELL